jgi:hypothetical protein
MKKRIVIGYMDKVDWDYELGQALDGNKVFPSIDALKKYKPCVRSCGIVKVEVRLKEVIQDTDFSEDIRKAKERKEAVGVGSNPQTEASGDEPGQVRK